ncbi:MFS transporter [Ruicaihuangia caeni]|uniref:MFS transporter n=1 Tax=Ruicaihuangia caeni TaxID=3042517 RepID=UPI00338FF342
MTESRTTGLLLSVVAAQFLVMLDSSVINVALPSLTSDLGLDSVGAAWVLNSYFLTFGGLLLVAGRAADVFGRRRMFMIGAAALLAGSLLGVVAGAEGVLLAARLMQGAGAALLSPAAMAIILARFDGRARAGAMSAWGAASTVGGAVGVTAGGLVTGALGWQSVFVLTAGVAALVTFAAWKTLPPDEDRARRSFDVMGALALTGAAIGVVFAVLSVPHYGWVSVQTLGGSVAAGVCFAVFVTAERRAADPVLPLTLLRDPRVAGGIAANAFGGAARIGCFVLIAMVLQQVMRLEPESAGLAMLPTSIAGFAVSALVLPRLLAAFGPERVTIAGLASVCVAHIMLSNVSLETPYWQHVLPALLLAAFGVAASFTPTTLVIAQGIAARNAGVGSGLASSSAQVGGAVGLAVFGAIDTSVRAAALEAGESALTASQTGLSAAHLAAAIAAALAVLVALGTFPGLRRNGSPRRTFAAPADRPLRQLVR